MRFSIIHCLMSGLYMLAMLSCHKVNDSSGNNSDTDTDTGMSTYLGSDADPTAGSATDTSGGPGTNRDLDRFSECFGEGLPIAGSSDGPSWTCDRVHIQCYRSDESECVNGNLTVSSEADLQCLKDVQCLAGTLEIASDVLENVEISGLNRVCMLVVRHNSTLKSLRLTALKRIEKVLWIDDNPQLEEVDLGGIVSARNIFIGRPSTCSRGNKSLTTIKGLEGLAHLSTLSVIGNPLLPDLRFVSALVSPKYLTIQNNASLVDLRGLESIRDIVFSLRISDNNALERLDGLSSSTKIPDRFFVTNNPNLPTCQAIHFLYQNDMTELHNVCIEHNLADICSPIVDHCNYL